MRAGGEPFAQFPQADGIRGEVQVSGDLLKGDTLPPAPVLEGNGEASADVALEFGLRGHWGSLGDIWAGSKRRGVGAA